MKCVLLLLVAIAATVTCSQAQTTTSGPALPQPVTACGKRALKCYRDVKPTMDTADAAFDYVKVCRQFKLYEDCFHDVINDAKCANETEVTGVNDVVLDGRDGICLTDGTVTQCGSTVQTCMGEAMAILDAYSRKNVTAACTLNGKIETCQAQVDGLKDCAAKIKTAIDTVATGIVEDGYLIGCEGPCGAKLGNCMNNVTNILVSRDFLNIDWSAMCSDVYKSLDCVRQISTDSDCVGNQQLASMLDSQNQVFGDYCAGRGQPSACIQQLQQCTSDWKAVGTNVPVQGRCQADATYLECSSKIPCAAELQSVLIDLRGQIDDAETSSQCPVIGSCADRLATCNSLSKDIITTSSPTSRCDTTQTALSCFDFVRSDANCVTENLAKTDFETELPGSLDTACPNPCVDKLAYCSFWEAALKNINKATQGDQYCRLATSGNACFNKVRTDTKCQDASLAKSAFETSLQSDLSSTCAAGDLVASVFLVCTVVMMRVLRYL